MPTCTSATNITYPPQQQSLGELDDLAARSDAAITRVPYLDAEVRAVYGLRALGAALFAEQDNPD